jgi:hypothetical protein
MNEVKNKRNTAGQPRTQGGIADGEASARAVAKRAEDELSALLEERATATERIQEIKRLLLGLAKVFGVQVLSESTSRLLYSQTKHGKRGPTDACRQVILEADRPLRPAEICREVQAKDGVLENHKDPVASVTTIMTRLCEYGEVRHVLTPDGHKAWESTAAGRKSRSDFESPR